jgi:hypothetical protein
VLRVNTRWNGATLHAERLDVLAPVLVASYLALFHLVEVLDPVLGWVESPLVALGRSLPGEASKGSSAMPVTLSDEQAKNWAASLRTMANTLDPPVTTPTPPPTPIPPATNYPNFQLIFDEQFAKDCAEGQALSVYGDRFLPLCGYFRRRHPTRSRFSCTRETRTTTWWLA